MIEQTPLTLPARAPILVVIALLALGAEFAALLRNPDMTLLTGVLAFFISGFLADAFTGLAHFSFDYVFPFGVPVLVPIAKEFNEHHDEPTLDPSQYVENFTKGAYASLPLLAVVGLVQYFGLLPVLTTAILLGLAIWAFFFHHKHAYAPIGAKNAAADINRRIAEIAALPKADRVGELRRLFETVPIPFGIRLLQRARIILCPSRHNIHHIEFESDFSSVNGWSDPVLNLLLRPLARHYKRKSALMKAMSPTAG